ADPRGTGSASRIGRPGSCTGPPRWPTLGTDRPVVSARSHHPRRRARPGPIPEVARPELGTRPDPARSTPSHPPPRGAARSEPLEEALHIVAATGLGPCRPQTVHLAIAGSPERRPADPRDRPRREPLALLDRLVLRPRGGRSRGRARGQENPARGIRRAIKLGAMVPELGLADPPDGRGTEVADA